MNIDLTGLPRVKSSYSGNGGNCVQVVPGIPGVMPVEDSKNPDGPALIFSARAWEDFIAGVNAGEFELPG